jgi:SPP1 gp7 family putative phage head morphogenesis protein
MSTIPPVTEILTHYADALLPWATHTSTRILQEIDARDRDSWRSLGNAISSALHREILSAPTGQLMRELLSQQVRLIQSIPIEAAKRVHALTLKGLENSTRASEIAREIRRSGEVAESRAILIARTEVARTASTLTQVRSEYIGSTSYIWETTKDADVRPGHLAMQGRICEWARPPAVNESGRIMHFHPGKIWNCRCWPRPILPV